MNTYQKQWNLDRLRGINRSCVPIEQVLPHIELLISQGATPFAIARVAGLGASTVQQITTRMYPGVYQRTARRLLAVTIEQIRAQPQGYMERVGSVRRVQALMTLGWTHAAMLERCGVRTNNILVQRGRWVSNRTAHRIAAMYDELQTKPGPSQSTRDRSKAKGFAPPMAWDPETIDDPGSVPVGLGKDRGMAIEDIELLARSGETWSSAVRRLGFPRNSIETRLQRNGRTDLARMFSRNSETEFMLVPKANQWTPNPFRHRTVERSR